MPGWAYKTLMIAERLYGDHLSLARSSGRAGVPGSRSVIQSHCAQMLKQARLRERLEKGVRSEEFTFPGDPMRLDYGYRSNGTRGFVQMLSVSRAAANAKLLAYTVERIRDKVKASEFTAVTDVALLAKASGIVSCRKRCAAPAWRLCR